MTHTPGPWFCGSDENLYSRFATEDNDFFTVYCVETEDGYTVAYASKASDVPLLAASPDLLAVVKLLQFCAEDEQHDCGFCRVCGGTAATGHVVESPVGPACPIGYAIAKAEPLAPLRSAL
jgi:hypothetical protein